MSENPLTPTIAPENTKDDFEDNIAIHAADAARRISEVPTVNETTEQRPTPPPAPSGRLGKAILGATVATGLAVGGGAVVDAVSATPEPSTEKTTYVVEPGDGLYNVVEGIPGVEDPRDAIASIEADPANIDVLKDGLQPGEAITIPVEFNK